MKSVAEMALDLASIILETQRDSFFASAKESSFDLTYEVEFDRLIKDSSFQHPYKTAWLAIQDLKTGVVR